jgi:hypothetical protein
MSNEFGVNVWWTCPEFVMDGEKAQQAFEAQGFEPEKDLPLPSRRNVVSRAAYSFQDRRHNSGRKVTEKAKDNDQYVVYGILSQTRKGSEEVAYDQGTTVRLDKDSGRVEATGEEAEDFYKALDRFDGAITDDDVRNFLRKVVKMCYGVAKRPSGGIYFVPERFAGIVESAQRALEALGIGARLYVERVVNGEAERQIVWEAVESDIGAQIDATLKAVERIEKRASSVQSHEAKLDELGGLMDIYRGLLGEEAKHEELAERLEQASQLVAAKMSALQDGRPSPKAKKSRKSNGGVGAQLLSLVEQVLRDAGKPMHYREIASECAKRGFELRGEDKGSWVNSWISESFRNGEKRFQRLGKGLYKVAS